MPKDAVRIGEHHGSILGEGAVLEKLQQSRWFASVADQLVGLAVLQMHHWRQSGWSYGRITAELNRLNVTSKAGAGNAITYKGAKRVSRGLWQCGNVHKVLTSKAAQVWLSATGGEPPS